MSTEDQILDIIAQASKIDRAKLTPDATLESLGFALLRIPNADIHDHRDGVRETILAALERRDTV